jgi:hypothetical protein
MSGGAHHGENTILDFGPIRLTARQELEKRGNPVYDDSIYLSKEAWKLADACRTIRMPPKEEG